MKKIVICNQKGGVGKTLSTINIAGCLSKDSKVLVIDCDAQANSSECLLSLCEETPNLYLTDYLNDSSISPNSLIKRVYSKYRGLVSSTNIWILPTDERQDFTTNTDTQIFQQLLSELDFDYVLFDCPPQRTDMMICAMAVADYVLIPATPRMDSIKGYGMVISLISDLKKHRINETVEILGIFLTDVVSRSAAGKYIEDTVRKTYGDIVFENSIARSEEILQAQLFGMAVCFFRPKSVATSEYEKLTREILERINKRERKVGR